jgi:uncharacterized membrane protein SpoIIM required for sporulation
MILDLPRFVKAERPSWTELESLLDLLEERPDRSLSLQEATRFHFLYQKVASDLARIATFACEPQLRAYLESLVARAYGEIHGGSRQGKRKSFVRWFAIGFPRAMRRRRVAFYMSFLIMLLGGAFGGFAVALDDEAKFALVPEQFSHVLGNPADRVAWEESRTKGVDDGRASFAGMLMANNIRVSIVAMALGMTWGVGTFVALFYNGVILGLVAVDYILAGQTIFLLGWLMPHGVIELPAVIIAGQAGFVLASAVIARGSRRTIGERLRAVAPDVSLLIGGVAVMLVWAGIVESFFSQYHEPVLPYWVKISFGVAELIGLLWFIVFAGRQPAVRKEVPAE